MADNRSISKLMLRDDHTYLERMLLHASDKVKERQTYKKLFLKAYEAEPIEHKKANAGRYAANIYLTNKWFTLGLPHPFWEAH